MIFQLLFRLRRIFGICCVICASNTVIADNSSVTLKANQLLEQRCMVCHGCYDAPCQLKLEANAGLQRGASKDLVYDSSRLRAGKMTRLFDDGFTERQWRKKGFYPVLDNENPKQGIMHRMLSLKQAHPLPSRGTLPEGFDFSLYRDQQCSKQDEFDRFEKDYPLWGMPYGLPGLNPDEHKTMVSWIEKGAPAIELAPLTPSVQRALVQWEKFLNGESNKSKLMSRYLYEHLFLAAIYFENNGKPTWFRIVRSYTKPGRNIGLLSTTRPYDDPRTKHFYYRLQRMPVTALKKRHMPYLFDQARIDLYRELFLTPEYEVKQLPGYSSEIASNPFKSFEQIPVDSRYRFLLAEAQFSIMNFIKGPVCRGQIALNVIDDHFWVMFIKPGNADPDLQASFLAKESDNLRLPSDETRGVIDILTWKKYARAEARYKTARQRVIKKQIVDKDQWLTLDAIWDGDGTNDNAALTIFRHFDTASVVKGFVGKQPKTVWVIDYSLLERIHYLLVAGFDVYGSAVHQLTSRLYMDFLRMDGEFNFLLFMPPKTRVELRDYWYRGASKVTKESFFGISGLVDEPSGVRYKTKSPKSEFLSLMRDRIYKAKANNYSYSKTASADTNSAFQQLENNTGAHNQFMPGVSFVNIIGSGHDEAYTIIRNSGYSSIGQLFDEKERRLPAEDSLTIVRGFIGAYPNYFFQVSESQIGLFASDIANMKTEGDYETLVEHYGVHRNAPWFWRISDKFHQMQKNQSSIDPGLFDYNRYHSH